MLLRLAHYECLSNYSLANIVQIPLPPSTNGDGSQKFLETTWHISFSSIHFEYRRSYIIEKEKKKINGEEGKKFSHAITKCDYSAEDPKLSRARITLRVNKISADPCWSLADQ